MPEDNAPEVTEPEQTEDPDWLKKLRKDAEEAKSLRAEVARLQRQAAMDEIGIPKTGAGKLFREKWDGDPADLDGLRNAASEYELIPAGGQPSDEEAVAAAQAATQMAEVTDGGAPPQPTVDALLAEARSIDEIERIMADQGLVAPRT